ncbi:MAG TPA: thiamine phosphate synthase [Dehalococcoidia bacterium]|nr:thiamine phosphate synthase [Dehalococcoidia bacterium]
MPLPTRIGRVHLPVLCLVVSKADAKDGDLEKLVSEAVAGGVDMVQLRDHSLPAGELLELARNLKRITRGKALLVINDRVDVAEAAEADGVQIPENGLPTRTVRSIMGRYVVLGRSVHTVDAAHQAGSDGAEFVIAGTIYKSPSKPDVKPVGAGLIAGITKDSSLPVLAIGGVTADKVEELIQAGASGVAVVSAITKADDPKAAAEALNKALKEAWTNRGAAVAASA